MQRIKRNRTTGSWKTREGPTPHLCLTTWKRCWESIVSLKEFRVFYSEGVPLWTGEAVVPTYAMLSQGHERRCLSAKTPTRTTHTKSGHHKRSKCTLSYVIIIIILTVCDRTSLVVKGTYPRQGWKRNRNLQVHVWITLWCVMACVRVGLFCRPVDKQTSLSEVYDFASQVADQMIAEKQEVIIVCA